MQGADCAANSNAGPPFCAPLAQGVGRLNGTVCVKSIRPAPRPRIIASPRTREISKSSETLRGVLVRSARRICAGLKQPASKRRWNCECEKALTGTPARCSASAKRTDPHCLRGKSAGSGDLRRSPRVSPAKSRSGAKSPAGPGRWCVLERRMSNPGGNGRNGARETRNSCSNAASGTTLGVIPAPRLPPSRHGATRMARA